MADLSEVVTAGLESLGADGLYNSECECACKLDDLFPCLGAGGGPTDDCCAGRIEWCDGCELGNERHFHIGAFAKEESRG